MKALVQNWMFTIYSSLVVYGIQVVRYQTIFYWGEKI